MRAIESATKGGRDLGDTLDELNQKLSIARNLSVMIDSLQQEGTLSVNVRKKRRTDEHTIHN
jgi:hypothetical protein